VYVIGPGDLALLERFYRDVYLPAFAHQREPLEAWTTRLVTPDAAYEHTIVLAGQDLDDAARGRIDGGVVFERYPRSRCGFVTYLVVSPASRRGGLGTELLRHACAALRARGVALIVAEVHDPDQADDREVARRRVAFFEARHARVLDVAYVQPDLGAGLGRDHALRLLALFDGAPPPFVDGEVVRAFVAELYDAVEGGHDDVATRAMLEAIGPRVATLPSGTFG